MIRELITRRLPARISVLLLGAYHRRGTLSQSVLPEMKRFAESARDRIQIVSGELPPDVYEDPTVLDVLGRAVDRQVRVEILTGPEASPATISALKRAGIQPRVLPRRPGRHFWMSDGGRLVKLEEPHPSNGGRTRSFFIIEDFKRAPELQQEFSSLRDASQPG